VTRANYKTMPMDKPIRVDLPVRGHTRRAAASAGRPLHIRAKPARVSAILLSADLLTISICAYVAVVARWVFDGQYELTMYFQLWPMLLLFVSAYACVGLYPSLPLSPAAELRKLTVTTSLVWAGLIVLTFMLKEGETISRGIVIGSWISTLIMVPGIRAVLRMLFSGRSWWGYPVVVIGRRQFAARLVRMLRRRSIVGLKPAVVLDLSELKESSSSLAGVPRLVKSDRIEALAKEHHIPVCLVPMSEIGHSISDSTMNRLTRVFPKVIVVPEIAAFSSLWVAAVDLGGTLGIEVRNRLLHKGRRIMKRMLDFAVIMMMMPVFLPLVAIIALLVKLDSPGPALFKQHRIGHFGNPFRIYKFRSMHVDAGERLEQLLAEHPELREEWEANQKLQNDPRITRIGGWLRKTSLDELPQVFNVMFGQMSLIGPRPIVEEEIERYGESFSLFSQVRPGITGLWQVSGRSHLSYEERVALDTYYVRNWSVWLDLYILSRTGLAVLLGKGAV